LILAVDDDPLVLAQVQRALALDGLTVEVASSPPEALAKGRAFAPALVLSDVMMPEMNGLEFRAAWAKEFPERATPFIFLSSVSTPEVIVQGLDAGAEDYCVKPVAPDVLRAKVRVVLRRQLRRSGWAFRGDLASLSVPGLLRYCEARGLTGYVDVTSEGRTCTLEYDGGKLDEQRSSTSLQQALELTAGQFEIHSRPIDFAGLRGMGEREQVPSAQVEALGRISSVRIGDRRLQVQTETTPPPEAFVVTTVTVGEQRMWKRRTQLEPGLEAGKLQALVDGQHQAVEKELESKLAASLGQARRDSRETFNRLCDEAFDKFRAGDFDGAIAAWESARELEPDSASVASNLRIARLKKERATSPR
jgi:DNA-binding response OmpR family regulator